MKIEIDTDGSTVRCEVNGKPFKDCDTVTKQLVFDAFRILQKDNQG